MRRTIRFLFYFLFLPGLHAQQDAAFTKYVFNSLVFNPAVAGSNEHLTLNLLHRQQWIGFEGAPSTQSLCAHTPLRNERVGVGMSLVNDKAGATGRFDLNFAYAYRFSLNENLNLSAGLQASVANWHGNWSKVLVEDAGDAVFQENISRWLPNFGAGLQLTGPNFYAGLGCPRLLEQTIRQDAGNSGRIYRHYYLTAGAAFPLRGDNLVFRPSVLIKGTGLFSRYRRDNLTQNIGAPTSIDLDASFFLIQTFWVGAAYRTALEGRNSSHDSADLWAAWYLRNGLRFGAAYDISLSRIRKAGQGSLEFMLGYEFDFKVKKAASPRFF